MQTYLTTHPEVVLVDPLQGIEVFLNRERFASLLCDVKRKGFALRPPKNFTLDSVQFPATVKTNAACQVNQAHLISFVKTHEALEAAVKQYNSDVVIQEYVRHSGQVYKVSVLGDYVQLDVHRSPHFGDSSPDILTWDSSKPLPDILKVDPVPNEMTPDQVIQLAEAVKEATGYSMMSFDVILDQETNELVLVDLNYFPSFRNIPDLPNKFDELFITKSKKTAL